MADAIVLPAALARYVRAISIRETDVQRRLREESEAHPRSSMLTSPEQAQFLALLARAIGARRCLEIGVFTGYTSLFIASALPGDGQLVACDVDEGFTARARQYWEEAGVARKIDLRLAPAIETLDALLRGGEAGRFDLIYVDADKREYLDYYDRALQLLRVGGIVAADNTLWGGRVLDPASRDEDVKALRAFNQRLHDDSRVFVSLLPIRDGLTLALRLS